MSAIRTALLYVALGALAGCVPWPHHYLTAPQISGTVTRAGQPVAGEHVQLADMMNETGKVSTSAVKQDVVTDAQGHFSVGPIRRFSWKAHVPLASAYEHTAPWGLLLSNTGQAWRGGWLSDYSLYADVLKVPVMASCDITAPSQSSVIKGDKFLVGNGPCQLAISESNK